jgi:hypothetical protein
MNPHDYLTAAQAARRLGITRDNVGWHCRRGNLEAMRFGPVWMVSAASVEALAARPGLKRGPKPRPVLIT